MEYYNDSDEVMIVTARIFIYKPDIMTYVEKVVTKTILPFKTLDVIEVISAVPSFDY